MYKAGTVKEIQEIKGKVPDRVYQEALSIVTKLDNHYGKDRDNENDDGGIVLIAESASDLDYFSEHYMKLESSCYEHVHLLRSEKGSYLNVLYLCNNEYGINLFIPLSIAPGIFLRNL